MSSSVKSILPRILLYFDMLLEIQNFRYFGNSFAGKMQIYPVCLNESSDVNLTCGSFILFPFVTQKYSFSVNVWNSGP